MIAEGALLHTILVITIQILFVVFLALNLLLVGQKGWRESRDHHRRTRRRLLEPRVLAYSHADDGSFITFLEQAPGARDRVVLEAILMDHAQRVRGIEGERLGRALDEIGCVNRYIADLANSRL